MASWRETILAPNASVRASIQNLSETGRQIVLVLDERQQLLGVVTDGDIRKALLGGKSLDASVTSIMNSRPRTANHDDSPTTMAQAMRTSGVLQLPVLQNSTVVGLVTLAELTVPTNRSNTVVLMAGGRGQRLRPLTDETPKPMLRVGGRPILETIVSQFIAQGFNDIVISVNYLGDSIKQHFGDGSRIGASIRYLHEDEPLGTAGALSMLSPKPKEPFIVMNGDILTQLSFPALLNFHEQYGCDASIVIREDEFKLPYGVVSVEGVVVTALAEKPAQRFFANAGIYVLNPSTLRHIRQRERQDMTDLIQLLITTSCKVSAFPLHEYWIDVGRAEQLERAQYEWNEPPE